MITLICNDQKLVYQKLNNKIEFKEIKTYDATHHTTRDFSLKWSFTFNNNQNSKEIDLGGILDIFGPENISNFKSPKTRHDAYDSTFDTKDYQFSDYSLFDDDICQQSLEVRTEIIF